MMERRAEAFFYSHISNFERMKLDVHHKFIMELIARASGFPQQSKFV